MSAKGTRHLKILKNNVSETVFPAFLHDFGGKYKAAAAYDLALCFQFVFGSGFEHKCRFFTTGRFQSSIMRVMRRDTWGLCPSFIHLISRHFPNFLQWARTNSLKARLDMRDNRKYITISLPSVYYLFIYIFKIL